MAIEYEATFYPVAKDDMRSRLKQAGAVLVEPEHLQKRYSFRHPHDERIGKRWVRVRDENGNVTMSYKEIDGDGSVISEQKEVCLHVDSFKTARDFLKELGCFEVVYQETKRELWRIVDVDVTIDTWPWLKPMVEIEGLNEEAVRRVAERLGFNYSQARFDTAARIYAEVYDVDVDTVSNGIALATFNDACPFKIR